VRRVVRRTVDEAESLHAEFHLESLGLDSGPTSSGSRGRLPPGSLARKHAPNAGSRRTETNSIISRLRRMA
jgi:hypothetical protein